MRPFLRGEVGTSWVLGSAALESDYHSLLGTHLTVFSLPTICESFCQEILVRQREVCTGARATDLICELS